MSLKTVIKRNGKTEDIDFNKITNRIKNLCFDSKLEKLENVDYNEISRLTISALYNNISTSELDNIAANICYNKNTLHPEYSVLAARLLVSNFHKNHIYSIIDHCNQDDYYATEINWENINDNLIYYTTEILFNNGENSQNPLLNPEIYLYLMNNHNKFKFVDYIYDYNYTYLGFKMLDTYLQKAWMWESGKKIRKIIERPQYMLLRVSVGIHCSEQYKDYSNTKDYKKLVYELKSQNPNKYILSNEKLDEIKQTYFYLRDKVFTHATPTMFNAGTLKPQLSSCFLIQADDSMEEICDYWKTCSVISKYAGGLGSHIHNIRASGSYIKGTNGTSNGIAPMLKVVNDISNYVDQGGNKRPGSHAVYLEPWHADIFEFLDISRPRSLSKYQSKTLHYAMWIPDEFMRTVLEESRTKQNLWYLMTPDISKNLSDLYDEEFTTEYIPDDILNINQHKYKFTYAYRNYIKQNKYVKQVSASELLKEMFNTIRETGNPYMLYKDSCNRKSNQKNLGTIKSSNLCTEIIEYTSKEEIAVCNLASINQMSFINFLKVDKTDKPFSLKTTEFDGLFDWKKYEDVIRTLVRNLNKIIDINFYPVKQAETSNTRNRPIAIGTQNLANLLINLRIAYDSPEAKKLVFYLYEFMYYIACDESSNLVSKYGKYPSFDKSPASEGILQPHLWIKEQGKLMFDLSLDWNRLSEKIKNQGMCNSLLIALMPTGSTSYIMGCSPCFEPLPGIIYKFKNDTKEYNMINEYFVKDMIKLGLWNRKIINKILMNESGSIENIEEIPESIKNIYKVAWQIDLKSQTDLMLARSAFIDQSQSFSIYVDNPTNNILSKHYFYNWKNGTKTASYYVRTKPASSETKLQCDIECKTCSS